MTQKIWRRHQGLEEAAADLDRVWQSHPYLTTVREVPTTALDEEIIAKHASALHEFTRSPQGKMLQLIGRSCVEWRGCAWNHHLDELCMNIVRRNETSFTDGEDKVLAELHQRITIERTQHEARSRTKEEIDTIIKFWWHLQQYRTDFLQRRRIPDTAEVILLKNHIQKVKRDLEDNEFWHLLTDRQKEGHLPSFYNSMLHNRCGWSTVADAIIKYQLPQLPYMSANDDIGHHVERVDGFCCDLLKWLKQFAEAALEKIKEEAEKARASAE